MISAFGVDHGDEVSKVRIPGAGKVGSTISTAGYRLEQASASSFRRPKPWTKTGAVTRNVKRGMKQTGDKMNRGGLAFERKFGR